MSLLSHTFTAAATLLLLWCCPSLFALTNGSEGDAPSNSLFGDKKVYTFAYSSRSLLTHSNITTDAQVR